MSLLQWAEKIPAWVPLFTSGISAAIAILAYRRGAPPVLPKVWVETVGFGEKGATFDLHVKNHTARTVYAKDISIRGGLQIAPPPERYYEGPEYAPTGTGFRPFIWGSSLPVSKEVIPDGSLAFRFCLSITPTSVIANPSIALSISTTWRTITHRAIVVPIIVPASRPIIS